MKQAVIRSSGVQPYAQQLASSGETTGLLLPDFDDVVVLHIQLLRSFVVVDAAAVEEKAERSNRDANTFAVGFLQLAHLGSHLDTEVDLVRVLSDYFQLDVFRSAVASFFGCAAVLSSFGHFAAFEVGATANKWIVYSDAKLVFSTNYVGKGHNAACNPSKKMI